MQKVEIIGAVRTATGKFGGALRDISPLELASAVIKSVLKRAGIEKSQVERVVMGEIVQTTLGGNPARESLLLAGLPIETTAYTVNMNCGSSLMAVIAAAQDILPGNTSVAVAGGMESMSQAPYLLEGARWGYRYGDGILVDMLDACVLRGMGETAENLADKYNISREEQDEYALFSHQKALRAIEEDRFKEEIVPIQVTQPKDEPLGFSQDESPRGDTSLEKLIKLKPVFKKNGTVTAGNSCPLNDGASVLILMSEERRKKLGLESLGWIKSYAIAGVEPRFMGIGPVQAVKLALEKANLKISDIELIELNEAFAAQTLSVIKELGLDKKKVNVNGGAIALGHPVGATGAKILTTLLYEMKRRNSRYGLATLCIGGGQGMAVIIEKNQ